MSDMQAETKPVHKGHFVKGQSGNAKGRAPGYQNFTDRAQYLLALYTIGQMQSIAKDPKRFKKLSVFDAMIIQRLVEGAEKNGGMSMDRMLDRLIGKAIQPIAGKIDVTHNVAMTGIAGEIKALTADDLQAIKSIIDNNTTDAEYIEVKE